MNGHGDKEIGERFQQYLQEGHFLAVQPDLIPLSLVLYRRLGEGVAVQRETLADDLGIPAADVGRLLAKLPPSTVDIDQDGSVIAFGGLSIAEGNHEFHVDGRELYTWCVFDGLFLPQLLEKPATLITRCPITGSKIEIDLTRERIIRVNPAQPVMSLVAPESEACCDDLRGAFCNHVNFFSDQVVFATWAAEKTDVTSVSVERAHSLAMQRNRLRYRQYLKAV